MQEREGRLAMQLEGEREKRARVEGDSAVACVWLHHAVCTCKCADSREHIHTLTHMYMHVYTLTHMYIDTHSLILATYKVAPYTNGMWHAREDVEV